MKIWEFDAKVAKYMDKHTAMRRGQAYYNLASELFGEQAVMPVIGSIGFDPFYNDNMIDLFKEFLVKTGYLET